MSKTSRAFPTQFVTAAGLKPRDIKAGDRAGLYVTRTVGGKSKTLYLTGATAEQRRLNPDVYDARGAVRADLRDYIYAMTRDKACRVSASFTRPPLPSTGAPPSSADAKRALAAEDAAARCEERASDLSRRFDAAKRAAADAEAREVEIARRAATAETAASRCVARETKLESDVTRLRDTVQTLEETKRELKSELGVQRVEIDVQRATLEDLQHQVREREQQLREGRELAGVQFEFAVEQAAAHRRELARLAAERGGLQRQLALVVASERATSTPPPRSARRSPPSSAPVVESPFRSSPAARAILQRIDTIDDRIDQLETGDAEEAARLATRDMSDWRRSFRQLSPIPSSSSPSSLSSPSLRR